MTRTKTENKVGNYNLLTLQRALFIQIFSLQEETYNVIYDILFSSE